MRQARIWSLAAAWTLLAGLGGFAAVAGNAAGNSGDKAGKNAAPTHAPDAILVQYKTTSASPARLSSVRRAGLLVDTANSSGKFARLRSPKLPSSMTAADREQYLQAKLKELQADPNVEIAEPDYYRFPQAEYLPDDPEFPEQWHLRNDGRLGPISGIPGVVDADIDATDAWGIRQRAADAPTNPRVTVAVIDTGVDYTLADWRVQFGSQSNIYANPNEVAGDTFDTDGNGLLDDVRGWDFANGDNDPQDDNAGHGTSVAGVIAAMGDNQNGISGICWDAVILPLKVFKNDESFNNRSTATVSRIVQAIDYAISKGARIINCSFGANTFSAIERAAITRARHAGLLVVCAAGNSSTDFDGGTRYYPAGYSSDPAETTFDSKLDNVLAVAATNRRDELASGSNYGATSVDIAAPGEEIMTLWPGNRYQVAAGTSMSAGIVSGAAALLWSHYPTARFGAIRQRLLANADRVPGLAGRVKSGRLNLGAAFANDTTVPGQPTSLQVIRHTSGTLQLSWVASGDDGVIGTASRYRIWYQLDSGAGPNFAAGVTEAIIPAQPSNPPTPSVSGDIQTYLLQDLNPLTDYNIFIEAYDEADNPSGVVAAGPFTTADTPTQLGAIFLDSTNDFYSPLGLAAGPFFTGAGGWAVTNLDRAGLSGHSTPRAYSDSPNDPATPATIVNYGASQDRILTMNSNVNLVIPAQFASPTLVFSYTLELGPGDRLDVESSVNNGATWSVIPGGSFGPGAAPPTANSASWQLAAVPLTPVYGGLTTVEQEIKIRFRLRSDATTEGNGVHLDDILVIGEPLLTYPGVSVPTAPDLQVNGPQSWATSSTSVQVSWIDQSTNEDLFILERRTGGAYTEIARINSTTVGGTGTLYTHQDNGLTPNTTYTYRVSAYNTFGTTYSAATYTVSTSAPAPAPGNLQAIPAPGDPNRSIQLTWNDTIASFPTPEIGFKVERRSEDEVIFTEIGSVAAGVTTFVDDNGGAGLAAGKLYYYRVRAFNNVGNGSYSNEASSRVGPPKAPTNLAGQPQNSTTIRLTWTRNSGDETSFTLERSLTSTFDAIDRTMSPGAGQTAFNDNVGLVVDTTYYYRIRANGPGGSSSYAESNVATVPFYRAAAPSNLIAAKLSSSQIRLDWSDNSTDEIRFEIEQRTDPLTFTGTANVTNPPANATTATRTGLTAGTTYYYRIRAVNVVGASDWVPAPAATQVSATTDVAAPADPSGFTASLLTGTTIRLRWTDNSTDETGFSVEQTVGGNTTFRSYGANDQTVNAIVTHDITVTPGATYVFRVRAEKVGAVSNWVGPVTVDVLVPNAPSGLLATALSGTQIRLNWTDNSNNESGFIIERSTDNFASVTTSVTTTAANAITFTDSGLTSGVLYNYRVRAVNIVGESANAMANATTLVAPAAPSGLVATSLTASQIRLTWSDNSGNETGFQIERVVGTNFATGSGRTAWNVGANATSYNEPAGALATGVTYTYRVRAFNAAGTSAFSNEATSTTLATPATPTGLTATVSGTVITLQWNDTSLNEAGFRIERKVNSGAYIQIRELDANNTSTVTYADTNLTVGNSYTYRVRAYNSVGNSGFSNEATGTITSGSALPAPSNLTATALSGLRAQITWTDNSTTETGFRIERQLGSGAFVEIAVVAANQTAYVDSRLQAGSVYTYRVRAYSGFKTTTYTNVASITAIR